MNTPDTGVRVGTWNVQYARGVEKNRRRRAHLLSKDVDVWVLTETHDELDLSGAGYVPIHSHQRYATPGGRWTTIWSRLPVLRRLATGDPSRCVAALLDGDGCGELVVYGTVLPWNGDTGPSSTARGWDEFARVVPLQGAEWARLRGDLPAASIVVAGDLNQDLGGRHYYGTRAGRALLGQQLAGARLVCLTQTGSFDPGVLEHPPIDHVCAGAGHGRSLTAAVEGWDRDVDGVRLSDHGGVVAHLTWESAT